MLHQPWRWMAQNADVVAALADLLIAVIWLAYLQLFLREYLGRHRPYLVIHHAQGETLDASCLLVNMSQEIVHVQCVMACVTTAEHEYTHQVTDYRRVSADDHQIENILRQGPLQPGEYLLLGCVQDIIMGRYMNSDGEMTAASLSLRIDQVLGFEIRAVALHGPSGRVAGARRRFTVEMDGEQPLIHPQTMLTEQFLSRRKRRQVLAWLHNAPF
jgi:hypothetical protein